MFANDNGSVENECPLGLILPAATDMLASFVTIDWLYYGLFGELVELSESDSTIASCTLPLLLLGLRIALLLTT